MDRPFLQFLCRAFLLLHPQSAITNAGSSQDEKKLSTKATKKKRVKPSRKEAMR